MDHLNINHQRGRHDLVKAFYCDLLGLTLDPRKQENVLKGRKTVWANAGITQFHLPEAENAQVFDGVVTLAYKYKTDLMEVIDILKYPPDILLDNTFFGWSILEDEREVIVSDSWGSKFKLILDPCAWDDRGCQPGSPSRMCTMSDLCVNVHPSTSLAGIARYYEHILEAPCLSPADEHQVAIIVSPLQTLTFKHSPSTSIDAKEGDLERDEEGKIISNAGPHISIYIKDLPMAYQRASELGAVFVNTRYKRQAFSLDDAIDQCMFRTINIIDPANIAGGAIFRLEHEIRSVVNRDGTKYKSCPFDNIVDL